jgi:hypothetical protein
VGKSWIFSWRSDQIIALYSHGTFIPTGNFRLVCGWQTLTLFFYQLNKKDGTILLLLHDVVDPQKNPLE